MVFLKADFFPQNARCRGFLDVKFRSFGQTGGRSRFATQFWYRLSQNCRMRASGGDAPLQISNEGHVLWADQCFSFHDLESISAPACARSPSRSRSWTRICAVINWCSRVRKRAVRAACLRLVNLRASRRRQQVSPQFHPALQALATGMGSPRIECAHVQLVCAIAKLSQIAS